MDHSHVSPAGDLTLRRFSDPAAFLEEAGSFLRAHEAEHCLPLGIAASLIERPGPPDPAWYLALVARAGTVVATAIQTPPFRPVLSRTAAPDAVSLLARNLHDARRTLPGVVGPSAVSHAFAEEWRRLTGRGYRLGGTRRVFQLEEVIPVNGVPGCLRTATEADRGLLVDWARAFMAEALPDAPPSEAEQMVDDRLTSAAGGFSLWEDGGPVSLVGYGGPTPNGLRIGPVYTPPEHRGKGYASAATAAVSRRLLESGRRFCFLFTDLSNPTSNRIYQAIGYRPVADFADYRFDD